MAHHLAAFAAGVSSAYVIGLGFGVAPPIIGKHENDPREFARYKWGKQARQLLDELDADWKYFLIRPKLSNRNYVQMQRESDRVKFTCYTSFWRREMRGVAKFGLDDTSKSGKYICVGAVSAAADQILGLYAILMILFPVVTANLDVKSHYPIPKGKELGIHCTILQGSDKVKKIICRLTFYSLDLEDYGKEYTTVVGIFVNSILPAAIKSML
jgi:hypothetical protein